MSDPERGDEAPWEVAELLPAHALEDIPWDRPAELDWPEPELDALAWNERWNTAAYDPDYPLPPTLARVPVAAAVGSSTAPRPRFGRPIRSPEDVELDDPYDEYAPVADDLQAPGQLTWTGGTVPLRAAASLDGQAPDQPAPNRPTPPYRPSVEPPTWSRSSRSVFGDYFAGSGRPAPSLPTPDRPSQATTPGAAPAPPAPSSPSPTPEPRLTLVNEYPPVPTDFKPQWASVAPVQPAWPSAGIQTQPAAPTDIPATWVVSSPAPAVPAIPRLPAPPPPAPTTATGALGAAGQPVSRPLPAVRPLVPPPIASRPLAPILADDYDQPAVALRAEPAADVEEGGPSTLSTLFWMAVTGVVVVGLVLAFLHFMTGLFR